MIVLTGGRQSGKTSALIRWLMESPDRGILCLDQQRAEHLVRTLQRAYPYIRRNWRENIVTVEGMLHFIRGRGSRLSLSGPFREMGIDDAEEVLSKLFGTQVGIAAMTATWIPLSQGNDTIKAYVEEPRPIGDEIHYDAEIVLNTEDRRDMWGGRV